MSNIAEGFNAGSDMDFVRFLGYGRRSNSEVQSQCYIALDLAYISKERFQSLYDKANLIERQLNSPDRVPRTVETQIHQRTICTIHRQHPRKQ